MKQLLYSFSEVDSDESLSLLAEILGSTYSNDTIKIPDINGSGYIKKKRLEEGLLVRIWEFSLNKPFVLSKRPVIDAAERVFHIAYILNPESLLIKTKGIEKEFRVQGGLNTLFVSNDIDIEVEIATTEGLHAIDISFTSSWLIKAFAVADEEIRNSISQLLNSKEPTVFFESTTAAEYRLLVAVHHTGGSDTGDLLHIKAGCLSLLAGFFDKIFTKTFTEILKSKFLYHEKMLEVEKILMTHLQEKSPSIVFIARQVGLSESTMKRYFKIMFGKSIHEYYLEKKMEYAKRILLAKPISVSEVAYLLDYEKVSNFIDMFKRHHGVCPGTFRQKSTG